LAAQGQSDAERQGQSDAQKQASTEQKAAERAREKALDDELLEGLGDDEGDDEAATTSPSGVSKRETADALDDELLRGLSEGEESELDGPRDPLADISDKMREVEQLIARSEAGELTQGKQREVADAMDKLIRQLTKQCQQCKQNSGKRPQSSGRGKVDQPELAMKPSDQAARDSSDRLSEKKPEKPDAAAMGEMVKAAWGHLPAHLRPEMEQWPTLEFLPEYLLLIEDYFKALANYPTRDRR
jgi:hypothetical protein